MPGADIPEPRIPRAPNPSRLRGVNGDSAARPRGESVGVAPDDDIADIPDGTRALGTLEPERVITPSPPLGPELYGMNPPPAGP